MCSSLRAQAVYEIIEARLIEGPFTVSEILPSIQSKDLSLDFRSARIIVEAALGELELNGQLRIEGKNICPIY
jgi:DNA-binding GntR family transcriptional regulator